MNDSHGTEGPMHVSYAGNKNKLGTEYLQSAKGLGYESAVDLQSFTEESIKKVGKWEKWVDPGTGTRSDAATGYVHPIITAEKSGLYLLLSTKVSRVIFEGTTAVGVEYVAKYSQLSGFCANRSKHVGDNVDQTPHTVKARKLVILSAGALTTPQILQRSRIGSSAKLHSLGINEIISDLPGVGMNYQDHSVVRAAASHDKADDFDTGDFILRATPDTVEALT